MTIKDIARESGYSVGTVSRALNRAPGISETAYRKIMEVVEKHNFQLNSNAKHLKQQSSDGIAIIVKGTQNMLFAPIVEQIQGLIKQRGYTCMLFYINEDDNEVTQALQICRERRPLGIMFLGSNLTYFKEQFSKLQVPCILVTNSGEDLGFPNLSSVSTDDKSAARYAIDQLFLMGHERIGILGGKMALSQAAFARYEGCLQAFQEHGVTFDPERQYVTASFSVAAGYYACGELLDKMPELTAVFAMSDAMAIGALRAIQDRKLRVPEDISVVGFDGVDIGQYIIPRLTTIRQQRSDIASRSVEILLNNMAGLSAAVHELEPFYLVPGESVRRL